VDWLNIFISEQPIGGTLLVLCSVAALGLALGQIKIKGIGLGVAGVLFTGIALSGLGTRVDPELLHFLREFGLILFVYAIGLHVGPGILGAMRRRGLNLNILAAGIVISGAILAYVIAKVFGLSPNVAAGLLAGSTTNTPSLAAAQQVLATAASTPGTEGLHALDGTAGSAYAIAYPLGIIGCIGALILVRALLPKLTGALALARDNADAPAQAPEWRNLQVTNAGLVGLPLGELPYLKESGLVVSRMLHPPAQAAHVPDVLNDAGKLPVNLDNEPFVPTPEEPVRLGDVLMVVGPKQKLDAMEHIVGARATVDLHQAPGRVVARRVVVTRRKVVGKSLEELALPRTTGATITRISRAGVEFTPREDHTFAYADSVLAVGTEEAIKRLVDLVGDVPARLNQPFLVPYFLGIALGVVLGTIAFPVPGLPGAVKLGLAGGPLLVAIVVSNLARLGPLIWYVPLSANVMMREFGIVLFLACVGLLSGDSFVRAIASGQGLGWIVLGALITILPLAVGAVIATRVMGLSGAQATGVLAGSMTDPPAMAFATQMAKSDAPATAYATVYPLSMVLRIVCAQVLVLLLT
jgi:putative transport protein